MWMTPVASVMTRRSSGSEVRSPATRRAPSPRRSAAAPDSGSRTIATTSSPRARRILATRLPMNPVAPVTTTAAAPIGAAGPASVDRRVGPDRLEPVLDGPQEGGRLGPVIRSVVDGEDHVHHRADRDDVTVRGFEDDGALGDRLHRQDRDLGNVDDRHRQVGPEPAGVVDGEGAAALVLETDLAGPRATRDLRDGTVQPADRELVDIAHDRNDQPVVDGDRDAHVHAP